MKIGDILSHTAATYPDHTAVTHHDKSISYRELQRESEKLAHYLKELSLSEGARVGIFMENSIDYVISYFAVFKAGLVAVPLNTTLSYRQLSYIISDCQAEVLLVHARYQRMLAKFFESQPALKCIISDRILKVKLPHTIMETLPHILEADLSPSDNIDKQTVIKNIDEEIVLQTPRELAAIFYTSGSTGKSKGVMLSHRNLIANTVGTIEYLKLTAQDSVIVILPFYYIYGNSLLLTHVMAGGRLVIDNRFMYAEMILDTMETEKVTGFSGVPSNFMILLNKSTFPQRKFEHLRYFTQAGGAMAPDVIRRLYKLFPHKEIYIMYGQTEASPRVTYLPPELLVDKLGSVGIEVPGVKVKIIKENGEEAATNEVGEIVVGGDSVMMGYWNQPEEQKEVLKNGWLYTGDLAKRDEDGMIFIAGRKKEIIKSGGNRISVKEVEECLLANENIIEAAVLGVKDDVFGEAVKAVIVLKKGYQINLKDIQKYCRQTLAEYKIPRYVEFMDSLPKHKTGKINKLALMEN